MPYKDPVQKQAYNREYLKTYRAAHRAEQRAYLAEWQRANPDKVREYVQKWRAANPDRIKRMQQGARGVAKAVREGTLVRPAACEECRTPGPVDAAHYDYARPLDVRWLCRSCHIKWDRDPKST